MSFDKVVDSAQLNSALTAEANAIRAKTGESAKIPWNATTGFASAISAIEGGKIAEGEFNPSTYSGTLIKNKPITVSGLPFKPSRVIFYVMDCVSNCDAILMKDSAGGCVSRATEESYDEYEDTYYEDIYCGDVGNGSHVIVTMNLDGFKISADYEGDDNEIQWLPTKYRYIALG